MPPPPEIKIKTEVPGNFFNEENMKFLEEVLDEVPSDCVSEADDDELDIDGNNTSKKIVMKIKPEPRSTPSPSSDYRKSPEPIATSIDETKRKTEKKKVEDNQRRTRKSRSRSSSSSRRKRQSPRPRSYIREQPRYRSRSRDKYKSRSPLRKVKRERRSSSEERQKRKQLKRSPCREVRRNRSNSRDRRRSRSNDRRRNNSRSRSKSRDRRRSRSNDRRRDSRGRRSRSPIKKLPFLEEVKKTLAAKGQSSVEIEEFERLQRQKLKMENASQVNSTSVSVPSPATVPPLPVQQRPSVELPPYGNGMMHVQNSTLPTGGECRNEPSTSKQLHVANPYENIPLPQPIKVKAGGECKHEPSTSKQLHGANPYDNIPLPQPFKVKAEPPDVVSLPDGTTQKIKKEKIDPRYEAIEVMPKAIKVERPAPPAATEKTKVLRLCDDAVNVFEKSDMEKASKSFLYTPTFVITHSEEYADNRSPLNRINNVLFKFNSTNSNIDTKQWGIHMLSENTSKIVRFVGYDVVKLIEKLRNRDIPEQFKMDNKNHNEISGPKYDTPYFTDSSTQTDDYSCGECIARKLKKHVSEGVQAVPLQEDIGCQATPNDELPLMMAIPTLNMSQQLATNDFVELLKGPMPTNSTEMYRLREKLLDIYNIAHRPTMILNTSAYNQTIAPIVNSQSNAFPPIMPMQHQQQLQSQYQNAMPVMLQQLGNNTNNVLAVQQQQQALLQMQQQQQQQHQLQASSNQQLMFQQSNPNAVSYANANRIVPPAPTMHTALNRQIVDPRVNNVDMFRNRSPPIMNNEKNRLESRQAVFGRGGKQIPARNPRPF